MEKTDFKAISAISDSDEIMSMTASGELGKILATVLRAYLTKGIQPKINADGYWQIGDEVLDTKGTGIVPQFRTADNGIQYSVDSGNHWTTLITYDTMIHSYFVFCTETEYTTMKAAGTLKDNMLYYIEEEI